MSSNIRRLAETPQANTSVKSTSTWKDRLTRNAAIATFLLLTVIGVRESATGGSGFFQAIQTAVESEWDQNVGRLTYVSNTLADTVQVFGHQRMELPLTSPVSAPAVQAWSKETPYLLYAQAEGVFAAAEGEVTEIAHDDNSYYIIRLTHENGLTTLYYGLKSCLVQEGDAVTVNTKLGDAGPEVAFSVQRNGVALDYSNALYTREEIQ